MTHTSDSYTHSHTHTLVVDTISVLFIILLMRVIYIVLIKCHQRDGLISTLEARKKTVPTLLGSWASICIIRNAFY